MSLLAAVATVLAVTFGHLLPPFDLDTFLAAGRHLVHGDPVYPAPGSGALAGGHAFVYPWWVAWWFAPLSVLPDGAATAVFAVVSVGSLLLSCRLLGRPSLRSAALVLASSTTVVALQMGTLNSLLLLAVAVAWAARDRPAVSGSAVALAAAAKLFLVPLLGWLIVTRRWRAAGIAAAGLAVLLGGGWAAGPIGFGSYERLLSFLQASEGPRSWSLQALLHALGASTGRADDLAGVMAIVVVAASGAWVRRGADERIAMGAAVTAALLLSPILWSSYLVLAATPVLLMAGDGALAAWALASWVIVTPDAASAARVAVGVTVAAAVAAAPLVRSGRWQLARLRARRLRPGPLVGATVAVAGLAATGAVLSPGPRSALAAMTFVAGGALAAMTASRNGDLRPDPAPPGPGGISLRSGTPPASAPASRPG